MALAGRVTNDPTNYFAVGVEANKGTDATNFYFLKHEDGTGFDVDIDSAQERIGGGGREIGLIYRTKVTSDGQAVTYAFIDGAARLLTYALGADASPSVVATTPELQVAHSITSLLNSSSATQSLPYLTVEQNYADETERTTDCLVSELKLDGEAGKPVKLTMAFISGGTPHTVGSAQVASRETGFPIMYPGASVFLDIGTASTVDLTKYSLDIKNQLDDGIMTTGLNRADVTWLNADYTVDATIRYVNNTLWNQIQYAGGTQVPTGLLTSGVFGFYAATPSGYSLSIQLAHVEFTKPKVNRLDPDGKTMYLDVSAVSKNVGTTAVNIVAVTGATQTYLNPAT